MEDIMSEQTIELDCPPGSARPDSYISNVLEGTGLEVKEPVAKFFGEWKWDYSDVPEEVWNSLKPLFEERISKLYHSGCIRYGSW